MKIKIIASTSKEDFKGREEYDELSGKLAGICYMPDDFDTLNEELLQKSLKRAELTKENRHHSVFDHESITLVLEDVPKLFAMLLNNEKQYTTSEKSARYTKMKMDGEEGKLYTKWAEILLDKIKKKYGNEKYFSEKTMQKLAQENGRYFLSVFTPTTFAYTTSYRQINYIYNWLQNIDKSSNDAVSSLKPYAIDFCKQIEEKGLVDLNLAKGGDGRSFSLIGKKVVEDHFGDTYSISYKGSFASFAQAQRHRSLNYNIMELPEKEFYVPDIIKTEKELKEMWLEDMQKVEQNIPQGQLVRINERGTPEAFILKMRERLCTCAQLEIAQQTKDILTKYVRTTTDEEIKNELDVFTKGARCVSGFNCTTPCGFKEGISLERII